MKTDSIFYRLFQEFPSIFFELIGSLPDEAKSYEFTSREIKQLAFRIDGIFLPTANEGRGLNKPFYLVEVQFQPDETLYYRIFGELFLYLKQYRLPYPWQVVVIYPRRSIEREETVQFKEMLALERVKRIYLDELGEEAESSLGVGVVKLVIESEENLGQKAIELVQQAKQQLIDEAVKRNFIDLIETILVYKLPHKTWEEIKAMFGLEELKQTRVYQDGYQAAKLELIPGLIQEGLSIEQISRVLKLPREVVQQEAQKAASSSENS